MNPLSGSNFPASQIATGIATQLKLDFWRVKMYSTYFLLLSALLYSEYSCVRKFEVAFQWNYINFTWPTPQDQIKHDYEPTDYVIAGIKIYRDKIYLALPRVKSGARVTLASIEANAARENALLSPFPGWDVNLGDDCDALHDVQSMEIDESGVMWVLDGRRTEPTMKCPPKIVLLDLNKNGELISSFVFPDSLCPQKVGCFLNDIVVDGDYAYISDTTGSDPGLLVYNRRQDKAWKLRDQTMFGDPTATNFEAQGENFTDVSHINGIALSPFCDARRRVYYMAQTSFHIFSISADVARDEESSKRNISKYVEDHGTKQGQSGGMMCDNAGEIYYGLLPLDAVGKWNTSEPLQNAVVVEENHDVIRWPDSFAFDAQGNLFLITNSILYFARNTIDVSEVNFRIVKLHTGTASYQHCNKS